MVCKVSHFRNNIRHTDSPRIFNVVRNIKLHVIANVVDNLKIEMGLDMPTATRHDPEAYALFLRARENLISDNWDLLDETEPVVPTGTVDDRRDTSSDSDQQKNKDDE